ncbi:uncharacterized protein SCHCODRAFT_02493507 [Schizophyllum commune H4-8]|nr:uncharacterized protein SCHCODRAFT_02493507 [Schizophyllum commune H4-8]KAI5896403.1 hypothetical protein SCHCODRAFT_02493507 [Schizophyllum commune H4-8]
MPSSSYTSKAAHTFALLLNTPIADEKRMPSEFQMQDMTHLRARSIELARSRTPSLDSLDLDSDSEVSEPTSPIVPADIETPAPTPQKRHIISSIYEVHYQPTVIAALRLAGERIEGSRTME